MKGSSPLRRARPWLGLALGACAVPPGPPPQPPVVLPQAWTAPGADPSSVQEAWWVEYGGPALESLLAEALERNHDLQAAAARVAMAAAQARAAGADRLPQIGAGFGYDRSQRNYIGLPLPGAIGPVLSSTSTSYGVSLDFAWEVDLWGALSAAEQAAVARWQSSAAQWEAARQSLIAQTAKSWFALSEAEQQLQVAAAFQDNLERSDRWTRARYEQGLLPATLVRYGEQASSEARALVELRRRQVDLLRRQIEILAGRYPQGAALETGSLPPELAPVPAGLPAQLLERRPDLIAAEAIVSSADARLRESRAALYPRLSLSASAGATSDHLKDVLRGDFEVWSFAANLTAPLFLGGRLRAGYEAAQAGVEESKAYFAGAVLQALAEVEAGLQAEQQLAQLVAERRGSAAAAGHAAELAGARHLQGLESAHGLLAAQRDALQAQSLLLSARYQRLEARIDLHLALGGGFAAAPAHPSPPPSPP